MGCDLQNMSFTEKVKLLHEQISKLDYTQFVKLLAGSADLQQLFLKIDDFNLKEYELTVEDRALMDTVRDKLDFDETQFQNILKNLSTLQAILGKIDGLKFEDLVNVPELVAGKIPKVKPDGSGIFWVEPESAANVVWGSIQGNIKNQTDLIQSKIHIVENIDEMKTVDFSPPAIITRDGRFGSHYFKKVDDGAVDEGTLFRLNNGDIYELQYDGETYASWFSSIQAALDAKDYGTVKLGNKAISVDSIKVEENKQQSIVGQSFTRLIANTANKSVIDIEKDVTRSLQKYIKNVTVRGNGLDVTGMKIGSTGATLYTNVENCMVEDCTVGIDFTTSMECAILNSTMKNNEIGLRLYSDPTYGGGNANGFFNTYYQQNEVGIFINNNSTYPLHNNVFTAGAVQGNSLCGLYIYGGNKTSKIVFQTMHFEANGHGASVSKTIEGRNVEKSVIMIDGANVTFRDLDVAESISPAIKLKNKAIVTLDSVGGYGNTTGVFVDGTLDETVLLDGASTQNGLIKANTIVGDTFTITKSSKFSFISKSIGKRESGKINDIKENIDPVLPKLANRVDIVSVQQENDNIMGVVESATFAASTGSTSSNRGTLDVLGKTGITSGKHYSISFLVRASVESEFTFVLPSGSHISTTVKVGTEWQQIYMYFSSGNDTNSPMYIFPNDEKGATLKITNLQSYESEENYNDIHRKIAQGRCYTGLFNDNTGGKHFSLPNLPVTDPQIAGQLWNSSGTIKVSAG